jgi:hypothetical protein
LSLSIPRKRIVVGSRFKENQPIQIIRTPPTAFASGNGKCGRRAGGGGGGGGSEN